MAYVIQGYISAILPMWHISSLFVWPVVYSRCPSNPLLAASKREPPRLPSGHVLLTTSSQSECLRFSRFGFSHDYEQPKLYVAWWECRLIIRCRLLGKGTGLVTRKRSFIQTVVKDSAGAAVCRWLIFQLAWVNLKSQLKQHQHCAQLLTGIVVSAFLDHTSIFLIHTFMHT